MKTWLYLNNPFLIAAQKSYRQGLKLSTFYNAQLKANISDPFFAGLYAVYNPLHGDLSDAYSNWLAQGGTLKGETLSVVQLLKVLSPTKINEWDYIITGVYPKGSSKYVGLLPKGHKPFNSGSKEMRIAAVKQLSTALTGIVALATLKTDVDSFLAQLTADRETQLGGKGATKHKSLEVETAIETAVIVMYSDFGRMISRFPNNPAQIEQYFDVKTIRSNEQLVFNRTVKTNKVQNVMQHTFAVSDTVTLINDGSVPLYFYLANSDKAPMAGWTRVSVEPNHRQTVGIAALGNVSDTFLNVYNADMHNGHCIVELI